MKNKIDFLATTISLVCLVQCLLLPIITLFGVVVFDLFPHHIEDTIILASVIISVLVTYHTYKVHKIASPIIIGLIGLTVYIINEFFVSEHYMHIVVSVLVGASHIVNYILRKNKCKHPHNCKK